MDRIAAMDINEALKNMRAAMARAQGHMDDDTDSAAFCVVPNHTVAAMMEAAQAVDEWLSAGGFLPQAWQR